MSTTTSRYTQPALVGGLVMGVLSGLPIIAAGNFCCCLWVISGGLVAAYVLQQNQTTAISAGDGATVGLLAGIVGAFVYLILSVPISFLIAPTERELLLRVMSRFDMPPQWQEFSTRGVGVGLALMVGFAGHLFVGAIFSTIGGVIGQAIFQKKLPPGVIDVPPPPPTA